MRRLVGALAALMLLAGVCGLGLAGTAGAGVVLPTAPILQVKKVVSGISTVGFTVKVECGNDGVATVELPFLADGTPDAANAPTGWAPSGGVWQKQDPALSGDICTVTETPTPAGVTSVAYSCAFSETSFASQVSPQTPVQAGCPGPASGPSSAPAMVTFPNSCAALCSVVLSSALVTVTNTFPQLSAIALDANTVQVSGSNFPPSTPITVTLHSTPLVLGTPTTGADGSFTATFSVPCSVGSGAHTVTGAAPSGQSASASVTLAPCPLTATPAFTG